jgi:hypothetical protein
VRGNGASWDSVEVLGAFAVAAVLLVGFALSQLRTRAPMLPMRFFRSRAFSAGSAAIFCAVGGLFCAVFFMSQFLQTGLGYDPLGAGLRLLPWTATLFFVAPVAGKLVDRFGERPFLVVGPLLQAVGFGWIALVAEAGTDYWTLVPPLMVAGVGLSMSFPAAQNTVVSSAPEEAIGKAAGTNSTMRELAGVLGIAIGVAAFAGAGGYASPTDFSAGFVAAISVSAGLGPRRVVRRGIAGAPGRGWRAARGCGGGGAGLGTGGCGSRGFRAEPRMAATGRPGIRGSPGGSPGRHPPPAAPGAEQAVPPRCVRTSASYTGQSTNAPGPVRGRRTGGVPDTRTSSRMGHATVTSRPRPRLRPGHRLRPRHARPGARAFPRHAPSSREPPRENLPTRTAADGGPRETRVAHRPRGAGFSFASGPRRRPAGGTTPA